MEAIAMEILNSIGDGVFCIDRNYVVQFVNDSARDILEGVSFDVGACNIFEVFNVVSEFNSTFFKKHIDSVFRGEGKRGLINNAYMLSKEGEKIYLSATISKFENRDQVIISFRDITRLKRFEIDFHKEKKKLETIVTQLPLGVLIIDSDRHVYYENPFVEKNFSTLRKSEDDYKFGATFKCVNSVDSACGYSVECNTCQIKEIIEYAFKKDEPEVRETVMVRRIDGEDREFIYSNHYIPLNEGSKRMMVIVQDVTQQKDYENLLEKARNEALETSRMKSEFLANMSHEIRTPLNGIIGMLDITHHQTQDENLKSNLEIAKASSRHLLSLINDVLDYSKLEAQKLKIYKKNFKMDEFLTTIIMENRVKANLKGIEFIADIPAFDHQIYYGDDMRIKQILTNIIDNAIKFTDLGSVAFKVVIKDDLMHVSIKDTGVGIPADSRDLFESFTQVDSSYTRDKGGTGLGLAITKQLVDLMDGSINYTSVLGKGTEFSLRIPIVKEHFNTEMDMTEVANNGKALRILLAEDDVVNQIVLQRKLEMYGYMVDIASDGKEAVTMFNQDTYDLVVMDIKLPEMNGMEVVDVIRKDLIKGRTPVIALTAHALDNERKEIMAHEFNMYISKPVDLNYLSKAIAALTSSEGEISDQVEAIDFKMVNNQLFLMENCFESKTYVIFERGLELLKDYFDEKNYTVVREVLFKMALQLRKEKYDKVKDLFANLKDELKNIEGGEIK